MKSAKKLLAVVMALAMVAAFAAMAFAASPSVKFSVGEYNTEKGRVTVTGYFADCVGLKSGKIKFGYADDDVTKITSADGADAENARKLGNACTYEFNAGINPAEFGFYFKEVLWATFYWDAAADDLEVDAKVNGENFEFAAFNFTAKPGAVITVTGELVFDGSTITLNQSFKVPGKAEPDTTTTAPDTGVSLCKNSLVKTARVEPSCTKAGNIEYYTCAHCGKIYSDRDAKNPVINVIIPATGHKFGEWGVTKEATETESGLKARTCSVCGLVETASIPSIPITDPETTTCQEEGTSTHYYYIGGKDCYGMTIVGFEPLTGYMLVDDGFGNIVRSRCGRPRPIIIDEEKEAYDYYVGGKDCEGKTILYFDPLTGWAYVDDGFGNAVKTNDPNARRSVILDNSSGVSASVVGSSNSNGSSSANGSVSATSSVGAKASPAGTGSVRAGVKTDGGKKTGDNGALAVIAGVVALAGAAFVATKKRK